MRNRKFFFAKVLVAGTIPILISCALQLWFGIYGPFETFWGLIVWFQKPIFDYDGVSGLFSNQNYLASWLIMIWPFSLYLSSKGKETSSKIYFNFNIILNYLFLISNQL